MFFWITRRKLKAAIARAYEDGKIDARLPAALGQTVTFYGEPGIFWPANCAGNNLAYFAYIRRRVDMTIYVGYAEEINLAAPFGLFQPA